MNNQNLNNQNLNNQSLNNQNLNNENQTSLKIETLTNEYNNILLQYQDTYKNYLNSISRGNQNDNFVTIPNSMFNSASTISESASSGVSNCQNMCGSNTLCSGATFNSKKNDCLLSSGVGNIINATSNYTAIVPENIQYSYQLKQLNQRLIDINTEISNTINSSYPGYEKNIQKQNEQQNYLEQNYVVLTNERENIQQLLRQYETLNQATTNSGLVVTEYYYKYIVFLFFTILLVFILLNSVFLNNKQSGGGNKNNYIKYVFYLLFFLLFLGLTNKYLNK